MGVVQTRQVHPLLIVVQIPRQIVHPLLHLINTMKLKQKCEVCNTKLVMYGMPVCPICSKGKYKRKYNFHMMQHYIEAKYKIKDLRDYAITKFKLKKCRYKLNIEHEQNWENKYFPIPEKYTKDPVKCFRFNLDGLNWSKSDEGSKFLQDKYEAYHIHPEGKCKEYPYLDFWHFIVDNIEIQNDCTRIFNWKDLKESATEDWQKEICQYFINEFGSKDMRVEISW